MTKLAAAARIGIARTTLYDVLSGVSLPDIHTVISAEHALGVRLWPDVPQP
jgi:DNA-binding phage protein